MLQPEWGEHKCRSLVHTLITSPLKSLATAAMAALDVDRAASVLLLTQFRGGGGGAAGAEMVEISETFDRM